MKQLKLNLKENKKDGISPGDIVKIANLRAGSKKFYNYFNFNVQGRKGEVVAMLGNEGVKVKIWSRELAFYFDEVKKRKRRKNIKVIPTLTYKK